MSKRTLKICHWTPLANHYQSAFIAALREQCDLRVVYFDRVPQERIALGWKAQPGISNIEHYCSTLAEGLKLVPDWRERVHLVPTYGGKLQRSLARCLVKHKVDWADWSEASSPGLRWWIRYPLMAWWTKLVNNSALGSFAIGNRAERDFARRGIPRSRIAFAPYVSTQGSAVEPDPLISAFTRGRNAFLFLGTMSHRKGIDVLLNAAAEVLRNSPDWALVLVGNDNAEKTYELTAEKLSLSGQVFFRGAVQPENLSSVISAANVLVLPSRSDGWGVAINEALLGGLAIIGSHMCGAAEHLIIPGRNGFRCEAGNKRQLVEAMSAYTLNPGLAGEHGSRSRDLCLFIDPHLNAAAMVSTLTAWQARKRGPAEPTSERQAAGQQ